jgi:endonuclease-8
MPEGDTIHKLANRLRPHLVGHALLEARLRDSPDGARLVGATVTAVDALGKHLLIHTDAGATLRTHLKMTGRWHGYAPGERWKRPAAGAKAVLRNAVGTFVCFEAPEVEVFPWARRAEHPALGRLGPDLIEDFDVDAVVARARAWVPPGRERTVADLLLAQTVAAGLGNVYKSELPFVFELHPWTPVDAVDDEALRALYVEGARLLRLNVHTQRRTTHPRSRQQEGRRRGAGLWVYSRDRLPCRRCRAPIRLARQGEHARPTYWCPRCQPASGWSGT